MKDKTAFYGNFAEPKETKTSKRSESVVLSALDKCEQLSLELRDVCCLLGEKEHEIGRLKKEIEFLNLRIDLLKEGK